MAISPQSVHERLEEVARQVRLARAARFAVSGLAVGLFFLTAFLLCDATFHFGTTGRWVGFFLVIVPLLGGLFLAFPKWTAKISQESVARRIEQACEKAGNVLISAVQFDRELAMDAGVRTALFKEMNDPFPRVDWAEVFDLKLLRRLGYALAAIGVVLFLWALVRPGYFANSAARVLLPASDIQPLTHTRFGKIVPGNTRILHGSPLELRVTLDGIIPSEAWLHVRDTSGRWQRLAMNKMVGTSEFAFRWNDLRENLQYFIEAGDARSATHRIDVRARTAIKSRVAEITPPAYTGAGPAVIKEFAAVTNVVPGSKVALTLEFSQGVPVLTAAGLRQGSEVIRTDSAHWKITETVMATHQVKLDYRDSDELPGSDTLQVAVTADAPPRIAISSPAEGKELFASRESVLAVKFAATDNFGLQTVTLYRSTEENPKSQVVQEWSEADGKRQFSGDARVDLARFTQAEEETATFVLVATDKNDVSGPGVTVSRPIVVRLRSAESTEAARKTENVSLRAGLERMIALQKTNIDETQTALDQKSDAPLPTQLNRQIQIGDLGKTLAAAAEDVAPETRTTLAALNSKELPDAVLSLRNASSAQGENRAKLLTEAVAIENRILTALRGVPESAAAEAAKSAVADLIATVEDLLRVQRDLLKETRGGDKAASSALSDRQDKLAERSVEVRKTLERDSQNASMGDQEFRDKMAAGAKMMVETKVYEGMLAAAEKLSSSELSAAAETQKTVVANLSKIADLLNQWQLSDAEKMAKELKEDAAETKEKLAKLAEIQKEILEKSKELARKDQFSPEDVATAKEISETKKLMAEVVEQMLTDAHVFPDLKPSNELRSELTSIYEDVIQADKEDAAEGKLKPEEIAVQKEDGILQEIEKAQKIAEDMEMWLPSKIETQEWKLENFDKTEMPEIPNLPLPDAFEDLVGDLMQEQQDISDQVQDAASNQAFAQNPANGWEVRDGPMPNFGAQGRSGNERPNDNEQTGRSSGGREGMSNGEMVGDTASDLEGRTPQARRTNDPMQKGQVEPTGGAADAKATGGGKASGVSQREGMEGNAPLRPTNAPQAPANDALAVEQAMLAQKASKQYAQASLLYLKSGKLADVARWMDESQLALRQGRIRDFQDLHRRIMARLQETKNEITSHGVISMPDTKPGKKSDKQLLGGDEGGTPAAYRDRVADYYRSLLDSGEEAQSK